MSDARTRAPRPLEGQWGVVTGASGGLGAALARDLAAPGANLILTARREGTMEELAGALCREHGVEARVVALDLARPGAADALLAGRSSVVAGRLNGTMAFLTRFASRRASARFILRLQGSSQGGTGRPLLDHREGSS